MRRKKRERKTNPKFGRKKKEEKLNWDDMKLKKQQKKVLKTNYNLKTHVKAFKINTKIHWNFKNYIK